jgi:hypothetical protein
MLAIVDLLGSRQDLYSDAISATIARFGRADVFRGDAIW